MTKFPPFKKSTPGSLAAGNLGFYIENLEISDVRYYLSSFQGIAFYEEGAEVKILAGRLPQNENEAMISDFTFESMQFGKLTDENGTNVELNGYEDFAKIPAIPLPFGGKTVEIVGVYEAEKVSAA